MKKCEEMIQILNVSRFEIRSSEQLFVNKFIKEKDLIREKHVIVRKSFLCEQHVSEELKRHFQLLTA